MKVTLNIGNLIEREYVLVQIAERTKTESRPYLGFGAFEVFRVDYPVGIFRESNSIKATAWVLVPPEHTNWLIQRLGSGLIPAKIEDWEELEDLEHWMAEKIYSHFISREVKSS